MREYSKYKIVGFIWFLIGCVCLFGTGVIIRETIILGIDGEITVASVTKYEPKVSVRARKKNRTYHYHQLYGDDLYFKVDLGQQYSIGRKIRIIYWPVNPKIVAISKTGFKGFDYINKEFDLISLVAIAFSIFSFYYGWLHLRESRNIKDDFLLAQNKKTKKKKLDVRSLPKLKSIEPLDVNEALINAVINNDISKVAHYISKGANPKLKNNMGYSAIDYARGRGLSPILEYLERII